MILAVLRGFPQSRRGVQCDDYRLITAEIYTVIAVATMSAGYRLRQVDSLWGLSFARVNDVLVVLKPVAFVASGSIRSRAQRAVRKFNLLYVRGTVRIRP